MISPELARKIRRIQIVSRKAVNDVLAGEYQSVFKGRGMEFDEVREYQPGDDIRTIDWNVTARTGTPHVKRYVEERELTIMFAVDLSASGTFGSTATSKNELAAEFCALVAFSAIRNKDKVGLVLFTDQVELFVPPAKGVSHVLRLIRDLLSFTPTGRTTDIGRGIDYLGRVTTRRGIVFLLSDFLADGYDHSLSILGRRHDLIAVSVADRRERQLPDAGLITLEDAETGELRLVDSGDAGVRQRFALQAERRQQALADRFSRLGIDHIALETGRDYLLDLVAFFRKRERHH
ncbi:MAG: DUF58 domain-containing protein [Thermodesulfobacteriota bacterium]